MSLLNSRTHVYCCCQDIDFLDSGKVANGFTVAAKLLPTPVDTSGSERYPDMGIVSQCSCRCGTAAEKVPAHSGMLVGLKKIGSGTGLMLAFLGPGADPAKGDQNWLHGPEVPAGSESETEVSFKPDAPGAKTGTITIAVNDKSKSFPSVPTPGGFGPYHYPWRVGWMGGGGNKCRDHAGEKTYDCGDACNEFHGKFSYAALCTGDCSPGECLHQAGVEASNTGLLLIIALWFGGTMYVGLGVAHARRQGRAAPTVAGGGPVQQRLASVVGQHPHWDRWVATAGLVSDGIAFSRARVRGKNGYSRVKDKEREEEGARASSRGGRERSSSREPAAAGKRGRRESRGKEGRGKEPKPSRSSSKKEGKKEAKQSSKKRSKRGEGAASKEEQKAEEDEEAASERLLQEQRDQSKHSSQQSITVVGLNSI